MPKADLEALEKLWQAASLLPWRLEAGDNHVEIWEERACIRRVAAFVGVKGRSNATCVLTLHNAWLAIKRELEAGRALRGELGAIVDMDGEDSQLAWIRLLNAIVAYDAATKGEG